MTTLPGLARCGCESMNVQFCNHDGGEGSGFCESCASFSNPQACYLDGLPSLGVESCLNFCFGSGTGPGTMLRISSFPPSGSFQMPNNCWRCILDRRRLRRDPWHPPRHSCVTIFFSMHIYHVISLTRRVQMELTVRMVITCMGAVAQETAIHATRSRSLVPLILDIYIYINMPSVGLPLVEHAA